MIKKKTIIFILKALVSISLLTILILNIDWDTVANNLEKANLLFLATASLLNLAERFELTFKWNLLIRVRDIFISFGRLFIINAIGSFLGLFLPSSLGTDVVKGYYLVKNNSEKSVSISSVFVDRVLGMFSLLTFGVVSVFFAGDLIAKFNLKLIIVALFILAVTFFYLFQKDWTTKILTKFSPRKTKLKEIFDNLLKLHGSILEYKKHPKTLMFAFLVTLLVQVTRVFTYYVISLSFGIHIPIVYFFLFIPLIMLVMMIPISVGGLGVREGAFVAFFSLVGMSVSDAVMISFMNSFLDILNTLILGGGGYLFYKSPTKEQIISEKNLAKTNE